MRKQILSFLLVLSLVLSLTPTVLADDSSELSKLDAPTDLTWGTTYEFTYDYNSDPIGVSVTPKQMPGVPSWTMGALHQEQYELSLYCRDEDTGEGVLCQSVTSYRRYAQEGSIEFLDTFCWGIPSGTYYFTVKALGDGVNYADSETAMSEDWVYVQPESKLPAANQPTLSLNDRTLVAQWQIPDEITDDQILGVFFQIEFSEELNGEKRIASNVWYNEPRASVEYEDFFMKILGFQTGYYYATVQMLSADITQQLHSEWSPYSEGIYLEFSTERDVADIVANVDEEDPSSVAAAIEAMQALDTNELAAAMRSNNGDEVTENIAALEGMANVTTIVDTSEMPQSFDTSAVNIVGAGLNALDSENIDKEIRLNITPLTDETALIIPTLYNDTVATSFSMDLVGVADSEMLEVPVKITLPVPGNINPAFLVILHYHANGEPEVIRPYVSKENGKWLASFVLTSFSDFAMVEERQVLTKEMFTVDISNATYTGNAITKRITSDLTVGTDYTVTYTDNTAVGTATITIEGVGSYIGTLTYSFKIVSALSGNPIRPPVITNTPDASDKANEPSDAETPVFTDVPADAYYADAVAWAVGKGITKGTTEDTFSPENTCTRAEAVTFLWRAAGEPEPVSTDNLFEDISESDYFYKAILWATEKGITKGIRDTVFAPDAVVTRDQAVTFLYRFAGSPAPTTGNSFVDVPADAYYRDAVNWAVANSITKGTGDSAFTPCGNCIRAQIVSFMYRFMEI